MIAPAVAELATELTSVARVCAWLGRPRASCFRAQRPAPLVLAVRPPRASPPNTLSSTEPDAVNTALSSPRFCDLSVAQTWATLFDERVYLASMSTIH